MKPASVSYILGGGDIFRKATLLNNHKIKMKKKKEKEKDYDYI